mmetsp:Transcript_8566/g.34862  ORF Transcript_8566/g.34862 Transcript_8566/m.34862 type:complete len:314 (-) Transcript_8566:5775-6716(-)
MRGQHLHGIRVRVKHTLHRVRRRRWPRRDDRSLHGVDREPLAQARDEELPALLPRHNLADGPLLKHDAGRVVHCREGNADVFVQGHELLLALLAGLLRKQIKRRIVAVHGLHEVRLAELDVHDALGLQHARAARLRRVHLHHLRVDGGVDDNPRATAQLALVRHVHEHGLAEGAERVDNVRAILEDLAEHVAEATREAAEIGEHHERQALLVEVVYHLHRLACAVREPHGARLLLHLALRSLEARVGRDHLLGQPGLDGDGAYGRAAQARAAAHHRLAPADEAFSERAAVEEVANPRARVARRAAGHHDQLAA